MKCSKCGTEIAEGMKSCPICGETSQYMVDSNQTAISDANTEDGFFKKLVAGEYSLFKTYWGLGAFMAILSLLSSIIDFVLIDYLVGATRGIWAVAVWNASSKYEGKKVWAVLAKSVVIFGIICEIYIMASAFGVTNKLPFNLASSTSNDNAGEAVTSRIIEVSVQQISSDYRSNEFSADEVYKGNTVRVKGTVYDVKKDYYTKMFCIVLFDHGLPAVKCIFDKGEEETLSNIRKGDTVSLVGDCIGIDVGDIVLLHSIIDANTEQENTVRNSQQSGYSDDAITIDDLVSAENARQEKYVGREVTIEGRFGGTMGGNVFSLERENASDSDLSVSCYYYGDMNRFKQGEILVVKGKISGADDLIGYQIDVSAVQQKSGSGSSDNRIYGQINGTRVNMRAAPSKKSSVVFQFPGYETVEVVDSANEGEWYKVSYNGHIGWVYGQFVK